MFAGVLEECLVDNGKIDPRDIKALAACYELKEYLADFFAEEKAQAPLVAVLEKHFAKHKEE